MTDRDTFDHGRATRFQAGAIGQPGNRTFYVYIEAENGPVWFLCEKGQVAALAEQSLEVLNRLETPVDEPTVERMVNSLGDLPWPSSPEDVAFRIGSMAMRIGEDDEMTLVLHDVEDERVVSFDVSREQLRAMALIGLDTVHSGRPICPKCHLPEDPAGHECPSTNGHREL